MGYVERFFDVVGSDNFLVEPLERVTPQHPKLVRCAWRQLVADAQIRNSAHRYRIFGAGCVQGVN